MRPLFLIVSILSVGNVGCDRHNDVLKEHHPVQPTATVSTTTSTTASSPTTLTSPPPLIEATLAGNLDDVRSLLNAGSNPNGVYHTNTALTYAARDGFLDIARILIDAGANVNWIDGEGVTPLILSSFKEHVELAQLLLDHGADPTIRDQWNLSALDYALQRGETDPIAQLLQTQL